MKTRSCDTSFNQALISAGYQREALNLWLTPCHHHIFIASSNPKLKIIISHDCVLLAELIIETPNKGLACAKEVIKVISSMQQQRYQAA